MDQPTTGNIFSQQLIRGIIPEKHGFFTNYVGYTANGFFVDAQNTVSFGSIDDPSILARTMAYDVAGIIGEADIQINTKANWSTANPTPAGSFDLQTVVLHEFGHTLELLDLYGNGDENKTMYGIYTGLDRQLDKIDKDGIRWIYGDRPLNNPDNLTADGDCQGMVLNWTDASDYEAGFKIYWGPDCNSLQYLNSVGPDVTTYFDVWDQPSCYMVCAYNHEGEYCSNKDSASPTLIPAVPSNLNADKACQGIKLTWTDNSTNESGFRIERSSLKGWSEIGEVGPGVTTFTASYICSNPPCTCSNQTFRVYAFNACGNSAVSNSATQSSCGLFTQPPAAPSNLTAENV